MSDIDDWETEDIAIPLERAPVKGNWDDEDVDENDIKESWDDDEEEEKPKAPAQSAPKPAAAKSKAKEVSKLKQKIAEREAEERKKASLGGDIRGVNGGDYDAFKMETPEERKRREQQQILESDLENARDLFAGIAVSTKTDTSSVLETLVPANKAQFDKYMNALVEKTTKFESHGLYTYFVENLMRKLTANMSVEDTRKLGSTLTAISNEKQRVLKEAAQKKKPKKATLKASKKNDMDDFVEDDYDLDDDEFM